MKPEILVLEPLFCVDFSVCEADQENEEREEERVCVEGKEPQLGEGEVGWEQEEERLERQRT